MHPQLVFLADRGAGTLMPLVWYAAPPQEMLHLFGVRHAGQGLPLVPGPDTDESDPTSCMGCSECVASGAALVCPNAPQVGVEGCNRACAAAAFWSCDSSLIGHLQRHEGCVRKACTVTVPFAAVFPALHFPAVLSVIGYQLLVACSLRISAGARLCRVATWTGALCWLDDRSSSRWAPPLGRLLRHEPEAFYLSFCASLTPHVSCAAA